MKKHTYLLLLVIASPYLPKDLCAQTLEDKKPEAFALGISMGFASYQGKVASESEPTQQDGLKALNLSSAAFSQARDYASSINSVKNILDTEQIENHIKSVYSYNLEDRGIKHVKKFYNSILTVRENYTATLAKNSANLTDAYVLGVNLAIAEGYASAGEVNRQIVSTSLNNAKEKAQSLNLDLTLLNECIVMVNATTPLPEIYTKLVSLRSTYQASL